MDDSEDVDSDTGLEHCSKNGTKTFTSNNSFANRTKDLQKSSLHSLMFLLSINVAFTMKLFLLSQHYWANGRHSNVKKFDILKQPVEKK